MFLDIKKTVWERAHLNDDVTKEEAIQMLLSGSIDYNAVSDWENLSDTEEVVKIEDNQFSETIELFEDRGDTTPLAHNGLNLKTEEPFKVCVNVSCYDEYADAPLHAVLAIDSKLYQEIKKQFAAQKNLDCYSMTSFHHIGTFGQCETDGKPEMGSFEEGEWRVDTSILNVSKRGNIYLTLYEKHSGVMWETEPFPITELDNHFLI